MENKYMINIDKQKSSKKPKADRHIYRKIKLIVTLMAINMLFISISAVAASEVIMKLTRSNPSKTYSFSLSIPMIEGDTDFALDISKAENLPTITYSSLSGKFTNSAGIGGAYNYKTSEGITLSFPLSLEMFPSELSKSYEYLPVRFKTNNSNIYVGVDKVPTSNEYKNIFRTDFRGTVYILIPLDYVKENQGKDISASITIECYEPVTSSSKIDSIDWEHPLTATVLQ